MTTDIHRRRTDYRWALLANAVRHRGADVLAECNTLAVYAVTRDTVNEAISDLHPCSIDEHCDTRDEVCSIDRRNNDHRYCCDCGEWMPT